MAAELRTISPLDDDASRQFGDALLAIVTDLKAFSRSLTGDPDAAEDLVQETMLRAWAAQHRFDPASSMRGWCFTILRNAHYSRWRRTSRETRWDPELDRRLANPGAQHHAIDLAEVHKAMDTLPATQREALVLVGAAGWSYIDAARMTDSQPGTVKSRVSRARAALLAAEAAPRREQRDGRPRIGGAEAYQSFVDEIARCATDVAMLEAAE
jgi:RNA polymerase sigma-70 factor (ECF subfamily)